MNIKERNISKTYHFKMSTDESAQKCSFANRQGTKQMNRTFLVRGSVAFSISVPKCFFAVMGAQNK